RRRCPCRPRRARARRGTCPRAWLRDRSVQSSRASSDGSRRGQGASFFLSSSSSSSRSMYIRLPSDVFLVLSSSDGTVVAAEPVEPCVPPVADCTPPEERLFPVPPLPEFGVRVVSSTT